MLSFIIRRLLIIIPPERWDKNVDNIMKQNDPLIEAQLSQLTATQEQMKKSKKTGTKTDKQ